MPKKKAKQGASTFPAHGRWPAPAWKELHAIQSRLKRDELTTDDKDRLSRILQAIEFDQDPRTEYWEQIDPRHLKTSAAQLRMAVLDYLLKQHGMREKQRALNITEAMDVSVETVRRAVTAWKAKPEKLVLYAHMRFENDPSYRKQLLQLGLTDADIEKLATKLRGS